MPEGCIILIIGTLLGLRAQLVSPCGTVVVGSPWGTRRAFIVPHVRLRSMLDNCYCWQDYQYRVCCLCWQAKKVTRGCAPVQLGQCPPHPQVAGTDSLIRPFVGIHIYIRIYIYVIIIYSLLFIL